MDTSAKPAAPATFDHEASFPISASADRVFRALSDPAELRRWFAENARVTPEKGGAFAFFGRATLGTPTEAQATQVLTAFEPGRRLAFDWTLHGVPTEVDWTVEADDGSEKSRLKIVHRVRGRLPFRNAKHVIDDLWRLHTGNLMGHLDGTDSAVLPDFGSKAPEVRLSIDIAAPRAKVFRALMDPKLLDKWLGGAARVDVARKEYSYGWRYDIEGRSVDGGPTRILEMVENERLVTDWGDWRGDPDKPTTRVTWQLEELPPDGKRTRVTIVHSGFELPVDRSDYQQGWLGFMTALQALLDG